MSEDSMNKQMKKKEEKIKRLQKASEKRREKVKAEKAVMNEIAENYKIVQAMKNGQMPYFSNEAEPKSNSKN